MSETQFISVIIPTCDRPPEYLIAAIESALTQSLAPCEVIVVDNGTQDADSTLLPDGIALYRLPPRVGPSRARNFGAAMARGACLSFLDDDDWWDPHFLQEAWTVMQAENARCVYGRKDIFQDGTQRPYKTPSLDTMNIPNLLRRNPCTGGINLLIQRELFWRIGGFDDRLRNSEDKALALEVLRIGERIAVAPAAAAVLRVHKGTRLRHAQFGRLGFVWKYRSLFGILGFISMTMKILYRANSTRLRTAFGRID